MNYLTSATKIVNVHRKNALKKYGWMKNRWHLPSRLVEDYDLKYNIKVTRAVKLKAHSIYNKWKKRKINNKRLSEI